MTGDGVQIISSGSILPVKELVEESNALKRAEEILGPDYTCVSARTHGTEVLCQHKTDKSDFTKVLFAGNKPAGSSSEQKQQKPAQPSASGNGINCQNWDLARVEMEARNVNNIEEISLRNRHFSMLYAFKDCFEKYGYTLQASNSKFVKKSEATGAVVKTEKIDEGNKQGIRKLTHFENSMGDIKVDGKVVDLCSVDKQSIEAVVNNLNLGRSGRYVFQKNQKCFEQHGYSWDGNGKIVKQSATQNNGGTNKNDPQCVQRLMDYEARSTCMRSQQSQFQYYKNNKGYTFDFNNLVIDCSDAKRGCVINTPFNENSGKIGYFTICCSMDITSCSGDEGNVRNVGVKKMYIVEKAKTLNDDVCNK